ncbi:replication initiator [Haloechinothrix salitolerans]|uniref:Replication initiator n=1 Tax=Haloechinothrix salitolerans TaxID=926830 RepID=A0ABW2C2B5_9PSEU
MNTTVTPMIRPPAHADVRTRAERPGYARWLEHTASAHGCVRPIRLTGTLHTVNPATGEIPRSTSTHALPDGVIYIPCGDRRATVCPACAETYRADTYHLIKSGLVGGKGTPDTVSTHPAVFTTLTAPSFGPVHTRAVGKNGTIKPCRMRRAMTLCEHGRPTWCAQRHRENDRCLGTPLCADCYDYHAHAVWNGYASELWRRTTIRLRRLVAALGRRLGPTLDVSFGKVAEYQHRGIVHFHAIIRLDARDPHDPSAVLPPPAHLTAELTRLLDEHIARAVTDTSFRTPEHPGNPRLGIPAHPGWTITWGDQLVNRPLARVNASDITEQQVAAYVAKYATKSTETTGFVSRRLTTDTIDQVDPDSHPGRLALACWDLGANPHTRGGTYADGRRVHPLRNAPITPQRAAWRDTYGRLRRWAHMLGFGGHFATRSRRYGPTRRHLKTIRRIYRRSQQLIRTAGHRTADHLEPEDTVLVVGELTYAGTGWLTPGDAELALTAAAKAREYHQAAKLECSSRTA